MNKEFVEAKDGNRVHKALPKSKALTNKVWGSRGGNGTATATATPYSPCQSVQAPPTPATPATNGQ